MQGADTFSAQGLVFSEELDVSHMIMSYSCYTDGLVRLIPLPTLQALAAMCARLGNTLSILIQGHIDNAQKGTLNGNILLITFFIIP